MWQICFQVSEQLLEGASASTSTSGQLFLVLVLVGVSRRAQFSVPRLIYRVGEIQYVPSFQIAQPNS